MARAGESMPRAVQPMSATLATSVPTDDERWGFEIKWDGIRSIAYVDDGVLRMTSRTLRDITAQYPDLHGLAAALAGRRAVLDGEIVALDVQGRPSFQRLQARMNVSPAHLTAQLRSEVPVVYVVFDLLYVDGRTLMTTSYEDRRAELDGVLEAGPRWHAPAYLRGHGAELLEATAQQQLEGIVAKRLASRYHPGKRGQDWLKIKNIRRQEFVIGGWLPGEGAFTGFLGALTVGYYDADGVFRYAGRVGTGMTLQHRRQLKALLAPLTVAESPFVGAQPDKPGAIFVRPELVCEVAFTQWTTIGTLRQPAYKGLRTDKLAADVIREEPG